MTESTNNSSPRLRSVSPVTPPESRKPRQRWTEQETNDLTNGCYEYGVGAWRAILNDPKYSFNNRTTVDLKDRFRTLFPEEYIRLYDAKKTAIPKKYQGRTLPLPSTPFEKVQGRRPRRPFRPDEDVALKRGVEHYGVAWAKIMKDRELGLSHRKSTDLRDRYRNAFPEEYERLGYSPKPRKFLTLSYASRDSPLQDSQGIRPNVMNWSSGDQSVIYSHPIESSNFDEVMSTSDRDSDIGITQTSRASCSQDVDEIQPTYVKTRSHRVVPRSLR
ncbi:8873_t:CDS:2 [Paraglomus occultum]|uniref:8873_t:CDS:1 n=1 Tax=Paraglomus occultum TaxID=144539 RepID=A0A9N9D1T4_9GLOM|nr:8873_t:CDS:2 [Paraglomus occultum]